MTEARRRIAGAAVAGLVLLGSGLSDAPARGGERRQLQRLRLEHDGRAREAWVRVPARRPGGGKLPLLIVLHGGGGTARGMVRLTNGRFNTLADERGFIVVYPQGLRRSWNDHRDAPISYVDRNDIDDVGFLSALIDALASRHAINRERVFATGISNGGFMSFRLACELPDRIRAIAPVTAQVPVDGKESCGGGVGLLLINGTEDPLVPYAGGHVELFGKQRGEILSTAATIDLWTERNRCNMSPEVKELPDRAVDDETSTTSYTYSACEGGVTVRLLEVKGGGHTWPGGRQYLGERFVGRTSRDFLACDEIWSFFERP